MDHLESEELQQPGQETPAEQNPAPEPEAAQPQQSVQPQQTAQPNEGYYHGVGTGQRESFYGTTPYTVHPYPPRQPDPSGQPWQQNVYQQSYQPQQTATPEKPKKKRKIWQKLLAAVLTVALVAAGCCVCVALTNSYWREQFDLQNQRFDEKLDALRQQLPQTDNSAGNSGGAMAEPGERLTPSQIYEQNVDSVVAITATVRTTNSYGQIYDAYSSGTGFVISEDGYVVTNHHVIEGATKITITMHDGTEYTVALIGSDATNDVALLKAEAQGLDPVTIGSSSDMQVGDQVLAIGNALGELTSSLTVGYVSGIDRDVDTDGNVLNMLQTDAAINSGNSGGPLFNAYGQVIGITTAKYSGTTTSGASIEGISFAIPIDDVIGMLDDLKEFGYIRSAYLGIYCSAVSEEAIYYGVPKGVYVQEAVEGYCAKAAGIREGDIIIGLGGYDVESMNDLSRALRAYEAGETVTVTVWRGGQEIILSVTLDEKPQG